MEQNNATSTSLPTTVTPSISLKSENFNNLNDTDNGEIYTNPLWTLMNSRAPWPIAAKSEKWIQRPSLTNLFKIQKQVRSISSECHRVTWHQHPVHIRVVTWLEEIIQVLFDLKRAENRRFRSILTFHPKLTIFYLPFWPSWINSTIRKLNKLKVSD